MPRGGVRVHVDWDNGKVALIERFAPAEAHWEASVAAAEAAAEGIGGFGSGALADDVRVPKPMGSAAAGRGALGALIGSDLPYAAAENFGVEIHARAGGLLRWRGGPTAPNPGSWYSAESVTHIGKRYLERALAVYPPLMIQLYQRNFPS
jgi:hypothetical protein